MGDQVMFLNCLPDLLAQAKAGKAEGKNYKQDVNSPKAARLGTTEGEFGSTVT